MFYNTGIGTYVWIVTNRKEKRRKGKIQLIDARDVWTAGRQRGEQAQPRRQAPPHHRQARSPRSPTLYGRFKDGETLKIFDNADFGYTRVTVERPLRLRYQMTTEDKARFLDACPHLLDDVQAIDKALGREPQRDWNAVWARIEDLLHERRRVEGDRAEALPRASSRRRTPRPSRCQGAAGGGYEPDADLRDFENVPLKDDIDAYFEREVRPHVPDAWMDRLTQGQGRLRDQLQPPLLQVHAARGRWRDRRGAEAKWVRRRSGDRWSRSTSYLLREVTFLVDLTSGATPDTGRAEYWDGEIPWVSPKDMKCDEIEDAQDHVSELALSQSSLRLIEPGALLIVVRGMVLAHSFPTAITTAPVTINQDMKALRCQGLLTPDYLRDFLRGHEEHVVSLADSSAHGTRKLETDVLGHLEIALPPEAEQRAIAAHIRNAVARLDAVRSATESTIALLKERRAALIAAAVTGRISVEAAA
jgi:hypothetical protein